MKTQHSLSTDDWRSVLIVMIVL